MQRLFQTRLIFCLSRGKSFSRRTRNGKILCKMSKVHVQIFIAIFLSVIYNMPYYFQYDVIPCQTQMEFCNCSKYYSAEEEFHPIPWWRQSRPKPGMSNSAETKTANDDNDDKDEAIFWMHCLSKFQGTLFWNIWLAAYEVS